MAPVRLVRPRVTYADLERTPEDGRRYELYDGAVFVVPAPLPLHQRVVFRLGSLLDGCCRQHGGVLFVSPIDIVFSEVDVVQPDVVYFRRERQHLIDLRQAIRVAPDLTIEVLSPSTARTDRGRKMQMFARYGVPEYWLVDPDAKSVEVYWLADGEYALAQTAQDDEPVHSSVLQQPGFSASVLFT